MLTDDPALRTDEAESVSVRLLELCTVVSNMDRNLKLWEVRRLERIRSRGLYSFHSVKVVVTKTKASAEADIPFEIDIYTGDFDLIEELEELSIEEGEKYIAIVATDNWFLTLGYSRDYNDDYCDLPYQIAEYLDGEIVFEDGGLEPEFRSASELTELMEDYGLWSSDGRLVPKSRKASKAWNRDEYRLGYHVLSRDDGTICELFLHAQIFSRWERVFVEVPPGSTQIKLIGNGWMLTVVGEQADMSLLTEYANKIEENLGCQAEDL